MAITENQAQRVLWVRSLEQAPNNGDIWSAHEAQEATRTTKVITGESSPFDLFVARRAEWIFEQLAKRNPELILDLSKRQSLAIIGWILIAAAFMTGFITDHLMADRWVNVIEWPIVLLIFWNIGFVSFIFIRYVLSFFRRVKRSDHSWSTDILGRWQLWGIPFFTRRKKARPWIKTFETHWIQNCTTLNTLRISLVFHAASIAFSIGTLGSLYIRGLFKAYRVGWESTFLSADTMYATARVVLAPGAWLFNMTVPDAEHIAGLHILNGRGDLAADWIHLYAGSILVCVVIPRFVLIAIAGYAKVRMQRNFPLPLSSIYYTALRSIRAGYQAAVLTLPFRYELTAAMKSNLTSLLERAHGLSSTITLEQSVMMGHDTRDVKAAIHKGGYIAVFVIFNLAATAEQDTHGRVMQRILKEYKGSIPVIPIVDTSTYTDRNNEQNSDRNKLRFNQRCDQWRTVLDAVGYPPLFLDLLTLDQEDARESVATKIYAYN